jgi:uncharacterized protein YndB with AHSA1/START domain
MSDSTPVQAAEREITITRILDAPRELVFAAWTDPDQVAEWFGPAGMDVPRDSVEIDLRVGGRFNLRMVHGGSGMEYGLRYEIVGLVEPELLVLKSEPMPEVGLHHATLTRIELEEEAGKTRMTLTDGPYPEEGGRRAGAGWEAAFDKLEALLVPSVH